MSSGTGAMQQFNRPAKPGAGQGGGAGLVLLYGDAFEQLPFAWPLSRSPTVIGREAPADLIVPVNAVSRTHAEFHYGQGGFVLRDLQSTNGTLVDGRLIQEARLEAGQEVRVGDAILKFVEEGIEGYQSFRLDGMQVVSGERLMPPPDGGLLGGYQIQRINGEMSRIAKSALSVMLLGESGTGKEVVARELHERSGREGAFAAVNCAAIPGNLLESELFGYKRGAFSGADRDKVGLIRSADQGTLLLDEIGDMPLTAQAKLLRVLQSREVFPVGATRPEPVDVRVICATHRDLRRMQQDNLFRADLFARLNEYQLRLPPLRDRKEDVYLLLRAFLGRHGRKDIVPSFRAMTALLHYDWPYNVRELEACAKRSVALAEGSLLDVELLPDQLREEMEDYGLRVTHSQRPADAAPARTGEAPTEEQLHELLVRYEGNVAAVGRELGKARMQIHRWLKKYDLNLEEYRLE